MDDPEFATEVNTTVQTILLYSSQHDLEALKPFLRVPGASSVQDPETGTTPLHATIAACGSAQKTRGNGDDGHQDEQAQEEVDVERAKEVVQELFLSGAIWNELDQDNETPGCLAWRLGQMGLYEMVVQAGVRAELLMNLMGGYQRLTDEDGEEESAERQTVEDADDVKTDEPYTRPGISRSEENDTPNAVAEPSQEISNSAPRASEEVNSGTYLSNSISFPSTDTILDSSENGVMMSWEAPIMARTVSLLCPIAPSSPKSPIGPRILNIGFGLGLIDTLFSQLDPPPSSHHIIEAHPSILSLLSTPSCQHPPTTPPSFTHFGPSWQSQPQHHLHAGRWQDILPTILAPSPGSPFLDESGLPPQFDAIYFDTFAEDYTAFKLFFTEFLPDLMAPNGKMSFFMGCGADRRVCYDVYTRVVECDLLDAGLGLEWTDVKINNKDREEDGDGEVDNQGADLWKGVKRKYFDVDVYRLPICEFLN